MSAPMVTRMALFDLQVCVPKEFTDAQVEEFANKDCPAGTSNGWRMRAADDRKQAGAPIRVQCADAERPDCVHIMLEC